jgi:carbon storage regulator
MLVLSRKLGEKIHIGNDITLTVVSIMGNRVQLGIEAPDDVSVLRDELLKRPTARTIATLPREEDLRDKPDCWNSPVAVNRWEDTELLMGKVQ